ncbi:MAG: DUF2277 domain-containing protein [Alphaproteobacteria bacterium]|nr:DUF2277 domain-containing protein [Alphaproteobacteria bacterium]
MCRNIKLLFNFEPPATEAEIRASALQYVRKVSGMRQPAAANQAAFDRAVEEITAITTRLLLEELDTRAAPRDREVEAQRARERGRQRDAAILARAADNG